MTDTRRASDLAGDKVKKLRLQQQLTAQQLAERCAELGAPEISTAVLANIESGRRDKASGKRRRDITADELVTLAYALKTSPLDLVLPESGTSLAITPDVSAEPDRVVQWFAGRQWPTGLPPVPFGRNTAHLRLYHAAWEAWERFKASDRAAFFARDAGEDETARGHAAAAEKHVEELARAADAMIDRGIQPPALNPRVAQMMKARGWLRHPDEIEVIDLSVFDEEDAESTGQPGKSAQ